MDIHINTYFLLSYLTVERSAAEFFLLEDAVLHFTRLMDRNLLQPHLCDVDLVLVSHCTFSALKDVLGDHIPYFQALLSQSLPGEGGAYARWREEPV